MTYPDFPVPVGVLRSIDRPTHDELMTEQITNAVGRQGEGSLARVLNGGETWVAG
jgi:2-oxoglutarate ferredoxin oxidoreductase subunit beta